jgi:hypothetical protein
MAPTLDRRVCEGCHFLNVSTNESMTVGAINFFSDLARRPTVRGGPSDRQSAGVTSLTLVTVLLNYYYLKLKLEGDFIDSVFMLTLLLASTG